MNSSRTQFLPRTGSALLLCGLVVLSSVVAAYSLTSTLKQSMSWVIHTHEVIEKSQQTLSTIQDMELRLRSYAVTAQPEQFRQYELDRHAYELAVGQLKFLTRDNPNQQERIKELYASVVDLESDSASVFSNTQPESQAAATKLFLKHRQLLNAIRVQSAHIVSNEQLLLRQRDEQRKQTELWTTALIAASCLGSLALFGYIFSTTRRYVEAETKTQLQLRDMNTNLESVRTRLNAVLDSMGEGLYQLNNNGLLTYMNPAAEDILGYQLDEIAGKQMHEVIHSRNEAGEYVPIENCPLLRVITEGQAYESRDDVFIRKDGRMVNVAYYSAPLIVEGKVQGAVVSFMDITEQKAANKRLREFYATLSHELRTPLSSIRGTLAMLDDRMLGELAPKAETLVGISRAECDRLVRLVNDILDLSKIEAGTVELTLAPNSANDLAERAVEALTLQANTKNVSLEFNKKDDSQVMCDRDATVQILTNLIANAIKFTPDGGRVTVRASREETHTLFSITDTGPGIPQEEVHKLFKRFEQLDVPAVAKQAGTGLGLAISKALVEQQGGVIGLNSQAGTGSTFWFRLRAATEES